MKKVFSILIVASTLLFAACERYDHAIGDLEDRLNRIEGTTIATQQEQIGAINASLSDLKAVNSAVQELIKSLTNHIDELQEQLDSSVDGTEETLQATLAGISNLKSLIVALQAKDTDLEGQIAVLKTYVDKEITSAKSWADATYATLEQYADVQTKLASLSDLLAQYRSETTTQFTQALTDAIATTETSMKAWVNELLADGYYNIAAIDAKLAALESKLTDSDAELHKDIEDQQAALEQAKSELTTAYESAIAEAIETNNGALNGTIADAIQAALNKVDMKLAAIDNAIAAIRKDIAAIQSSIATLEQQIAGIKGSLTDLETVDAALRQLINDLTAELDELQDQINNNNSTSDALQGLLTEIDDLKGLIAALQAKDADLEGQISELQTYVDGEISSTKSWAAATYATLEQYANVQTELATLSALLAQYRSETTTQFTQALTDAIATTETSMKAWVNELLADGYYNIAAIDAKLAALESKLTDSDAELHKDIEDQQAALEQAKAELTTAYESAIAEAIETNNGGLDKTIADAVQAALDEVDVKLAIIDNTIAGIQKDITDIQSNIATLEQQITGIKGSLTDLETVDAALQQLIDELTAELDELQDQISNNSASDVETLRELVAEVNNLKGLIAALQAKDTALEGQIAELQTYVDGEISSTKNWTAATYATLEQYADVQTELATLSALLAQYRSETTTQFTQALTDAIATTETSMKAWVNELLADGYYNIAAIDAKLAALESKLTDSDAELHKDIEDQQAALEQAKAELTTAYESAIAEAIETNNGGLDKTITDAIQTALNKVDIKLVVIDNTIAAIQKDIAAIQNSIASLELQIAGIKGSLSDLEAVDANLQQLIGALTTELGELQEQLDNNAGASAAAKAELKEDIAELNALIASLQDQDDALAQQIDNLKRYVDNEIAATKDWASSTFATLEKYAEMQAELAALKVLVGDGNNSGSSVEELTHAISNAIAASETSMKGWVSQQLASGYYDIATIDAKLAALKAELTSADTQLRRDIEAQQTALEQAKTELTAAYEAAITAAIDNNNGVITTAIEKAVQAAKADLQGQINAINSAIASLQTQIDNIANRIQSVTYIPLYSDGKVKFDYATKTTEVYLRLSPAALAGKVETAMVQAFVRYTNDPTTRALNEEFPVAVSVVAGDATSGMLHVCLAEDASHPFADKFWMGDVEAILYLQISDGNSNIVSPSIPVIAHSYVSGSSNIGGFGNGQSSEGIVQ